MTLIPRLAIARIIPRDTAMINQEAITDNAAVPGAPQYPVRQAPETAGPPPDRA